VFATSAIYFENPILEGTEEEDDNMTDDGEIACAQKVLYQELKASLENA
jgi:hypothetical protein